MIFLFLVQKVSFFSNDFKKNLNVKLGVGVKKLNFLLGVGGIKFEFWWGISSFSVGWGHKIRVF